MAIEGEQEYSAEVGASIAHCFNTLVDFRAYPKWSSPIRRTAVLERYKDKLPRRVEFELDMTLRTIRYVLEYAYDKPTRMTWQSCEGEIESIDGSYTLEKLGPKKTRVTCRQRVILGFWMPGPIRFLMERKALQQSVLEFKEAAERSAK